MPQSVANAWCAVQSISSKSIQPLAMLLALSFSLALNAVNSTNSISDLTTSAEQGNVNAQMELARIYHSGTGQPQNFAAAAIWLARAAAQGNTDAHALLGQYFAQGLGLEKDQQKAKAHLMLAANSGNADYQVQLAAYLESLNNDADLESAVHWYQQAAAHGNPTAQASLGLLYYQGRGVTQNFDKALELFTLAATQGYAKAQNNLGLMYSRGDGVNQDYTQAVHWFRLAVEQGLGEASTNLGVMYENGFGVAVDEAEATRLYRIGGSQKGNSIAATLEAIGLPYDARLAHPSASDYASLQQQAEAGDPVAKYQLAHLLVNPYFHQQDPMRAASLLKAAASTGLHSAMFSLGVLYLNGVGVPQDYTLGYFWVNKASALVPQVYQPYRDALLPHLSAEQINAAQQMPGPEQPH